MDLVSQPPIRLQGLQQGNLPLLTSKANTYLLPYLLIPWSRFLIEKLTVLQVVKKFPTFHGTRRFITAFTSFRHLSLSWASPIQSIYPHPSFLELHPNIIIPSPSGSPKWTLSLRFPHQNPVHTTPLHIHAICRTHLIHLDFITRKILGEQYISLSSSLHSFLHSHVTSSILCPNIPLSTRFSNTLSLRSSLNISDQVSHPYKVMAKLYFRKS